MKRSRRTGGRKVPKVALIIILIWATFLTAAGVYFHIKFSRMIDARLETRLHQQTAIYSRPYRIRTGQPLSLTALEQRLNRAGYVHERDDSKDWFAITAQREMLIHQSQEDNWEDLLITFSDDHKRISRIESNGGRVREAFLRPEFLSNLAGPSRERRRYVPFENLPEILVKAVLAAEDDRFFSHHGLDVIATIRAAFVNLFDWRRTQGGSTLTQQFVKNYFLTPEKTLGRKLEEAYLSILLENRLSKEKIFELYANEVYLGQSGSFSILGFGAAADTFFGKNVKDLNLAESALLAGMIQAPNRYSPYDDPEDTLTRRNYILDLMEGHGFITVRQNASTRSEPIQVLPQGRHNYSDSPYFVDHIKETLGSRSLDWESMDSLHVYTTLEPDLQKAAYEAVQKGLSEVDKALSRRKLPSRAQVALVAVDPRTGEIVAMLGGRNYSSSQYNRAVHARRQPGSTFKPFVLAAALEKSLERLDVQNNYTLASFVFDAPYTFTYGDQTYSPGNYGNEYLGRVSLRIAMARSLNVATVKLAADVGYDSVAGLSRRMGFDEVEPYPSLALGSFDVTLLELAQAYAAFANAGLMNRLHPIKSTEMNGRKEVISEPQPVEVIHPETAYLVTSAMKSAIEEGTGWGVRARGFRLPAAGKTGTSDDSWFIGYTPDLLCAVWVGLDDSSPLNLTGAQAALPIWTDFMLQAQRLGYLSGEDFALPQGVIPVEIDPESGLRAGPDCESSRTEYFIRGTEPYYYCYQGGYLSAEEMEREQEKEDKKERGFWDFFKRIFR
ncbi:MAG: transglycosylase domain-containing protein [Acidobacteriota bacterium]